MTLFAWFPNYDQFHKFGLQNKIREVGKESVIGLVNIMMVQEEHQCRFFSGPQVGRAQTCIWSMTLHDQLTEPLLIEHD
jgi:hypothetical protein